MCLLLERAAGNVAELLWNDPRALSLPGKVSLAADVARGLAHMHSLLIIHADLKSPNVLVLLTGGRFRAKICDFGMSVHQPEAEGDRRGTSEWMAPGKHHAVPCAQLRLTRLLSGNRAYQRRREEPRG
eukprot:COSAG04_NODE_7986_length_1038_cov_1.804047_2_plen_128_part_00